MPFTFLQLGLRAAAALRIHGAELRVVGESETLRELGERGASISRFGDGELEIMLGGSIYFQRHDRELARRLREILRSLNERWFVGIPNFSALKIKTPAKVQSWRRYRVMFSHLVRAGARYHSMYLTRPGGIVGLESAAFYEQFRALWGGRNVVLVHHDAAVAEHAMFRNARRVRHIGCAPANAFENYRALLENAWALNDSGEELFLLAVGPTASVLAWDLAERGAQAFDIGHLTNAFDEFAGKK